MISYKAIREGIASSILRHEKIKNVLIDDEMAYRVGEPAVLVQMVESYHELFSKTQVRRSLDFNLVYLAPIGTPTAEILSTGLDIVAALQPVIEFDGRAITVGEVTGGLVENDFHDFQISFTLDFFDQLANNESYEFMHELSFRVELLG